jgi:hypothetical protein
MLVVSRPYPVMTFFSPSWGQAGELMADCAASTMNSAQFIDFIDFAENSHFWITNHWVFRVHFRIGNTQLRSMFLVSSTLKSSEIET